MIDDLADMDTGVLADVGEVVAAIIERTGYKAELERSNDPQDATRLDNLNELVSVALGNPPKQRWLRLLPLMSMMS